MRDQSETSSGGAEIDELARDIEETRARIAGEIEALEERLSPAHAREVVVETIAETKDRVADTLVGTVEAMSDAIGDAASIVRHRAARASIDLVATVRANPLPLVLIGVGTGWLLWDLWRARDRALDARALDAGR